MTKVVKSWKKFSFWTKIRLTLGSLGIGSEVALHFTDSFPEWKIVAGIATVISIIITFYIQDEDKDGVVDAFEDETKP